MSLFDFFRKKPATTPPANSVPLEQSSYDIAYFILPQYVFGQFDRLKELCEDTPTAAGPFFYLLACQGRQVEPDLESAKEFHWRSGTFDDTRSYLVLEYPTPPPFDLGDSDPVSMAESGQLMVLAPYYSLILHGGNGEMHYYILGQAPLDGGTTVRKILGGGENCNLGPGPPPSLDAFFDRVRKIDAITNSDSG
ncbi:hypothetical protein Pan258_19160 [Symmachiella dynata]|uniref:Uncharacterized protein n=1 Tax=Symmachiella dynata TaxID=2527995 RepID=A0A517ZLX8_9PLAN|nr:hypothetical protein [Symmachiella dynata]QDT47876.1 hypothetical protein Pan258_19160 [Symmachiella dynata]QDU43478.1 hypothetical protein Mal52_19540 [Symmachiella dynata]